MKRFLSVLAIIIFVMGSVFAVDAAQDSIIERVTEIKTEIVPEPLEKLKLNSDEVETSTEVDSVIKPEGKKKVYIDKYFSLNPLLGFTLSPFDDSDLYIASGLQVDFYKYYGYKNYGTYLKLATLGEHHTYGSYEILFGGTYRYVPFDMVEIFANIGPSFTYYNKMGKSDVVEKISMFYAGAEIALGLRFYPIKNNNNYAINIGLSSAYMWYLPLSLNENALSSRYKVIGFVGYTHAFRGN